ncbi:MAG: helix-turn-helix transcriptional regulator [Sneathiella sp.]|nr:helix-turn-helix transcriptional regulator [Sneathiella sp.]
MMYSAEVNQDVYQVLDEAGATALRSANLGCGLSVAQWYNQKNEAEYDQPGHHTFSVYLNGGEAVERVDAGRTRLGGAPGKICLLPDDHRSQWRIPKKLEMFHLYFSGEKLKSMALKVFDRDPRQISLRDLSFETDRYAEGLVKLAVMPLDWKEPADKLALSTVADLFLIHILKNYSEISLNIPAVKGGLPPHMVGIIKAYVNEHFGDAISIDDLAKLTGYSSFHFSHMFKESFGQPPYRYLNMVRIEKAKELLRGGPLSLVQVALSCGFSSQAHFSARFKQASGVTPRRFRCL